MARGGKTKFTSGNPKGRPRGVPDRRNLFHWVSEADRLAVFEKCVALAKDGDPACMRLVIERIAPIELPDGFEKLSPLEQIMAVNKQIADGAISPDVGAILVGMIKDRLSVIEHEDMAKRLETLETLMAAINGAANE